MSDEEQEAVILRLRARLVEAKAREEGIQSELIDFHGRIREVRQALGNPFYYSGPRHGREENAEKSIEKFAGYGGHEVALQLLRDWQAALTELDAIRGQLRDAGVDVE